MPKTTRSATFHTASATCGRLLSGKRGERADVTLPAGLFTEGTLQELSSDNARFAVALLNGDSLSEWQDRPEWKKTLTKVGRGGGVTHYSGLQRSAVELANHAYSTAAYSNGQQVLATMKDKNVIGFGTEWNSNNTSRN